MDDPAGGATFEEVDAAVADLRARHGGDIVQVWGAGHIRLAAHAEAVARQLHDRFGDRVEVLLGCRRYPSGRWWPGEPGPGELDAYNPLAGTEPQPAWLDVAVGAPAVVALGPDQLITVVITNRSGSEMSVTTGGPPLVLDGYLTAPGEVVALSSPGGASHLMGMTTVLPPNQPVELPAVFGVGATPFTPGFTVAPGGYELSVIVPVSPHPPGSTGVGTGTAVRYRTDGVPLLVELPAAEPT